MASTAIPRTRALVINVAIGLATLAFSSAWFPSTAIADEPASFSMHDFGIVPRTSLTEVRLEQPAVQAELSITEPQNKERSE